MSQFCYRNSALHAEEVPLEKIAKEVGTPCYVYSHRALEAHFTTFDSAFSDLPHLTCFAMKSNSNGAVLRTLIRQGAGVDIVSMGELYRALQAGVDPRKVVYSGVGKSAEEMRYALEKNILQFNVESEEELDLLNQVSRSLGRKAPVALRVNPDIDPKTHPYISTGLKKSKFGIPVSDSLRIYKNHRKYTAIDFQGVDCHIGSQITQLSPFAEAVSTMASLIAKIRGFGVDVRYYDLGGGLGIRYRNETPPTPAQYARVLKKTLRNLGVTAIFEPGRFISGNAGILLTKVLYRKKQGKGDFVVVDAAMNDLIRPALYEAYQEIVPVRKRKALKKVTICGPVCETGDFFGENRSLPSLESGELVAILGSGAYGFAMSGNYNSRPLLAEVMVRGREFHVVRKRQSLQDLVRGEELPSWLGS